MNYVLVENGVAVDYPYGVSKLRMAHPNVSFPAVLAASDLASFGVYPVVIAPTPSYDYKTQKVLPTMPTLVGGVWTVGKEVVSLSAEEVAWVHDSCAEVNRETRDQYLADTDWTQAVDSPLSETQKTDWARYRAELRDLPAHSSWPFLGGDEWPVPPEE